MNKHEIIAQEKMDEVALKFFRPEQHQAIENPVSLLVPFAYRQWIYRITAKQVNWLIAVGNTSPNVHRKANNHYGATGSFDYEGRNYGWEITTIKGGAAQYKVTLILHDANKEQE